MTKTVDLDLTVDKLPEALSSLASDTGAWEASLADDLYKLHKAEQALGLFKAQLEMKVRAAPIEYGIAKVTEGGIASRIECDAQVVALTDAVIEAKLAVNGTKAIVNALDVKRSASKYLAELVIRGFTTGQYGVDSDE
jgi:hypothetical protein